MRKPAYKRYPPHWKTTSRKVREEVGRCQHRGCGERRKSKLRCDHKDNTLPEPARSARSNLQVLCDKHNTKKSHREAQLYYERQRAAKLTTGERPARRPPARVLPFAHATHFRSSATRVTPMTSTWPSLAAFTVKFNRRRTR